MIRGVKKYAMRGAISTRVKFPWSRRTSLYSRSTDVVSELRCRRLSVTLPPPLVLDIHLGTEVGATRRVPLGDVDVDAIFLPIAVEPVVAAIADVRVPVLEPRALRQPFLPHHRRLIKPVAATAIQETHLGVEAAPDLDEPREVVPRTRLVTEPRAVRARVAVAAGPV